MRERSSINKESEAAEFTISRCKQPKWFFGGSPSARLLPSSARGVNGLLVAKCQYHAFARITFFIYLFILRPVSPARRVRGGILTRGLQYRRALSRDDGGGGSNGGCGMVCRRWIESGGVVVHLASCRPQPVRRVRPLTVFIPRILDVQPAPLWSLRFCERGADNSRSRLIISLVGTTLHSVALIRP